MPAVMTLADIVTQPTKEGELYEKLPNQRVRLFSACSWHET